jgi:hypothetical protein
MATILTLEVKLVFDSEPLNKTEIELSVYDAILLAFQEGAITSDDEEAVMQGIDSVEVV